MPAKLMLLCVAAAVAGCGQPTPTNKLFLDARVVATGNGTSQVSVVLRPVGTPTGNVFLSEHESLVAKAGGESKSLADDRAVTGAIPDLWGPHYTATVSTDAADTEFVVAYERQEAPSAPLSKVTMPARFELTAPKSVSWPQAPPQYSRANDPITVTWTPAGSGDHLRIHVSGGWVEDYEQTIATDTGSASIPPNSLKLRADAGSEPVTTRTTLELWRERIGTPDPAFGAGSTITARQVRTCEIESVR